MPRATPRDDVADQQLRLLVGSVVVVGLAVVASAVAAVAGLLPDFGAQAPAPGMLAAIIGLVALSSRLTFRVRVRSAFHGTSWPDAAILVALAIMPVQWVILATALGVVLSKATLRVPPSRVAFGAAKESITACVGGLVLLGLGAMVGQGGLPLVASLSLAFVAMTIVDDLMFYPVIARASRTALIDRYRENWDIRQFTLAGRFAIAVAAVFALRMQPHMLYALPFAVWCVHLWQERLLRTREERQAWQQLAGTTESFTDVELDRVLHAAVRRGAELFSADEIEIELTLDGHQRLVRGNHEEIVFDGCPQHAPDDATRVHPVNLRGCRGGADIGVLRLRFRDAIRLSERERYTLQTFASALDTAVRNAVAYERLRAATEEHAYAAAHDPLTDLANRRRLEHQMAEALEHGRAGAVGLVIIDLNHFKEVNDALGHLAGDQVLVEVANRLRGVAGPDDLVARLGGDEFAVLLRRLPAPARAEQCAAPLLDVISEPIEVNGLTVTVEASAGIATTPDRGGATELHRRADVAMYQAKRSGGRLATYTPERDTADMDKLALNGQLRRAVNEREFGLHFQPIVDLASGRIVAAEALARWLHPERGELDPRWFLDNLERSEHLSAFTVAVLDQALTTAATWAAAGHDLTVSVNISPRSLLDHAFPQQVLAALRQHGTAPDRLCLELTETLALSQVEVVDEVLTALHGAGVRLALDDFGTGYSSLALLSQVPVRQLKIDRIFVRDMHTSDRAEAVVRSTVELGRGLDLVVVAEGVETEAQRRALWELGCTAGQGHLFARPMPADRLLSALADGHGAEPGRLAAALHDEATVVRLPRQAGAAAAAARQRRI